jgi:hypothetical protein
MGTWTLVAGSLALAGATGSKLQPKDLVGSWAVRLEVDYSSCPAGWGKTGEVTTEKWNVNLTNDGEIQVQIIGDGSSIDANNNGYSGSLEAGAVLLSNMNGHNSRLKLRGTTKLLTGRCMTAIPTSGAQDKNACAILYEVTAKKQG